MLVTAKELATALEILRVYDKRLELAQKGRAEATDYGVRWELELKKDRAQACAKALLTLAPDDWRAFLVGVLRSYVDFRETSLGHPLNRGLANWKALARAHGTSREIDCEAIGG